MRTDVVERARRVSRSWFYTVPGPYTSAIITDTAGTAWLMPISRDVALAISAVYAALGCYSDLIGTLPVQRLRGDERMPLPAFVVAPAGDPVGWTDEIGQALWSLLLRGNAYLLPTSHDATGYPSTFMVLDPDRISCKRERTGSLIYTWHAQGGTDVTLTDPDPTELLHIRWQRPPGSATGCGVLDTQGGTLTGAFATEQYAGELMRNPTPPAVLTHPLRLNSKQAEDLQSAWSSSLGRSRAVPAVLSGGITYQPLSLTPADVQLIESRRWNATEISTLFRLPPYLLGGSTGDSMTYSTTELEMIRLWTLALMPACVRLERAIGGGWLPNGQRIRFNPDALLRSQTIDRYTAHEIALRAGFETVPEVRELENKPPLAAAPPPPAPAPPAPMALPAGSETP